MTDINDLPRPDGPGSKASPQAATHLGRSGYDPSRVRRALETEEMILDGLTVAYNAGAIDYPRFSPAWDTTMCRAVALNLILQPGPSTLEASNG